MTPRADLIASRQAFRLPGYHTLADVGLDGFYVSPLQMEACSSTGPVLLAHHWLDAPSAVHHAPELRRLGYLPSMPFNRVVDMALAECRLTRANIYMTQAFHLLPKARSARVPQHDVDKSFQAITCYEIAGRKVIALGRAAADACRRNGVRPDLCVPHPSARGLSFDEKAASLAEALAYI